MHTSYILWLEKRGIEKVKQNQSRFPKMLLRLEVGKSLGVSFPYPRCSMYGIFTYIWYIFMVNVGKYTIHWVFGYRIHEKWYIYLHESLIFHGINVGKYTIFHGSVMGLVDFHPLNSLNKWIAPERLDTSDFWRRYVEILQKTIHTFTFTVSRVIF